VIRGGSFDAPPEAARSAFRGKPGRQGIQVGIRPAIQLIE
jgi:hypothetical protein